MVPHDPCPPVLPSLPCLDGRDPLELHIAHVLRHALAAQAPPNAERAASHAAALAAEAAVLGRRRTVA
jgi:hypothetical protein